MPLTKHIQVPYSTMLSAEQRHCRLQAKQDGRVLGAVHSPHLHFPHCSQMNLCCVRSSFREPFKSSTISCLGWVRIALSDRSVLSCRGRGDSTYNNSGNNYVGEIYYSSFQKALLYQSYCSTHPSPYSPDGSGPPPQVGYDWDCRWRLLMSS